MSEGTIIFILLLLNALISFVSLLLLGALIANYAP